MNNPHKGTHFFQFIVENWQDSKFSQISPQLIQRLNWLEELGITNLVLYPPRKPNKIFNTLVAFLVSQNFNLYFSLSGVDFNSVEINNPPLEFRLAPYPNRSAKQAHDHLHFQIFPNLLTSSLETGDASLLEPLLKSGPSVIHPAPLIPASFNPAFQKRDTLIQSLALNLPGSALFYGQPEQPNLPTPASVKAAKRTKEMINIRARLGGQGNCTWKWVNTGTPSVVAIFTKSKENKLLAIHNLSAAEVKLDLWRTGIAQETLSGKMVDLAGLDRLLGFQVMWLELE